MTDRLRTHDDPLRSSPPDVPGVPAGLPGPPAEAPRDETGEASTPGLSSASLSTHSLFPIPMSSPHSRRDLLVEIGIVLLFTFGVWVYDSLADFWWGVGPTPGLVQAEVSYFVYSWQVILPLLLILARSGEPWHHFGFHRPRWFQDTVIGFFIFVGTLVLPYAVFQVFIMDAFPRWIDEIEESLAAVESVAPVGFAEGLLVVVAVFVAAFAEELVFRGFLIPRLVQVGLGVVGALLVSSVLFSLIHIYQGGWAVGMHVVNGLVFGTAFLVTGRIWPVTLGHAMANWHIVFQSSPAG